MHSTHFIHIFIINFALSQIKTIFKHVLFHFQIKVETNVTTIEMAGHIIDTQIL